MEIDQDTGRTSWALASILPVTNI